MGLKIAFHDNAISELGTSVAIYDYAHFNETLLGNESYILGSRYHRSTTRESVERFKKRFGERVFIYNVTSDIADFLIRNKIDIFYAIKGGGIDEIIAPKGIKTVIHCTGTIRQPHGDVYAVVSQFMSNMRSRGQEPVVPHMVHLPKLHPNDNLRHKLDIPENHTVIGRYGGDYSFDIKWVHHVIRNILIERDDIWFIFINTPQYIRHPRIKYLPKVYDLEDKTRFINTSDAMLHARFQGESFGCSCAEFSICNKPVMTWTGSYERNHINTLGDKCLGYNNEHDLQKMLLEFKPQPNKDWNAYRDYSPEKVMAQFKKVFIK